MFFEGNTFKIGNDVVLGHIRFKPPYFASEPLENEARIVFVRSGHSRLHSASQVLSIKPGDAFIMRCEKFVNSWQANENGAYNELLVFKLSPSVLDKVYQQKLPVILKPDNEPIKNGIQLLGKHELFDQFTTGLRYYLNNSEYLNEELISTKLRELIHVMEVTDKTGEVRQML